MRKQLCLLFWVFSIFFLLFLLLFLFFCNSNRSWKFWWCRIDTSRPRLPTMCRPRPARPLSREPSSWTSRWPMPMLASGPRPPTRLRWLANDHFFFGLQIKIGKKEKLPFFCVFTRGLSGNWNKHNAQISR